MVAELTSKWKFGYRAVEAFNATDLSPSSMQKAYVDMLQHPQNPTFRDVYCEVLQPSPPFTGWPIWMVTTSR